MYQASDKQNSRLRRGVGPGAKSKRPWFRRILPSGHRPTWLELLDFLIKGLTLALAAYALFALTRPISDLQKEVAEQNYRDNIRVQFDYPRLQAVNSWTDHNITQWLRAPTPRRPHVYQAQFSLLNAPSGSYSVETYVFKRIVSETRPNIFQQYTRPITLLMPSKDDAAPQTSPKVEAPFGDDANKPRMFVADIVLVNKDPTTIMINVIDPGRRIVKTEYYSIA